MRIWVGRCGDLLYCTQRVSQEGKPVGERSARTAASPCATPPCAPGTSAHRPALLASRSPTVKNLSPQTCPDALQPQPRCHHRPSITSPVQDPPLPPVGRTPSRAGHPRGHGVRAGGQAVPHTALSRPSQAEAWLWRVRGTRPRYPRCFVSRRRTTTHSARSHSAARAGQLVARLQRTTRSLPTSDGPRGTCCAMTTFLRNFRCRDAKSHRHRR